MMPWRCFALLALVACDPLPGACPTDTPLSGVDVPCTCQGSTIEKVDCGTLMCTEVGITAATTTTPACTGDTG